MSLTREDVVAIVNELFRFGEIGSSKIGSSKSVQVGVKSDEGEESPDNCDVYGQAPLQYKPPTGLECLFMQRGDEKVVIGIKTRDWQVSLKDGEVIVQALGTASPAYLHLKPGGDAVLKGANVTIDMSGETKIGASAAQYVPLANLVTNALNALKAAINAATVTPNDGGANLKATLMTGLSAWPPSIAATKTKAL